MVKFEHYTQPLLPRAAFLLRLLGHGAASLGLVAGGLSIGVLGYRYTEGLPWIDALLNASMILGGMGPASELHTTAGKLFASAYALFAGLMFIVAMTVVVAPVLHRFLHAFHVELAGDER